MRPRPANEISEETRQLTSYNIKFMRTVNGMTQKELAELAGVSLGSLWRVEQGLSVRLSTVKKICKGMNADYQEMSTMRRMRNMMSADQAYVLHRAEQSVWFEHFDKRRVVPLDNQHLIQDDAERGRLGRLGMVSLFRRGLSFVMPKGPGIVFMEIWGPVKEPASSSVYEYWILYVLRGEVSVTIAGDTMIIKEGDAIGHTHDYDILYNITHPLGPHEQAPLLVDVGANLVGRIIRKPRNEGS